MTVRTTWYAAAAALAAVALTLAAAASASAAPPPADPFPVDEPMAGAFVSDQWVLPDSANNATAFTPGALRITSAASGGTGNATLAQSFPSDVAFSASFDYIAVGFDNAGNFSADNAAPFNVNSPNNVVLRGAAQSGGTGPQWPVLATAPATIQTDGVTPRHVEIEVEPSGSDSILLTVTVGGVVVYDHVDVRTVAPAADAGAGIPSRLQPARPATFFFGFSAGTGGATNNYDISDLVATAATDLSVAKSGQATVEPGATASWTLTVANDDTNPVEGAVLSDSGLPAGMTGVSWVCTVTAGSCPAASGTGGGPWSLDLDRGGTATVVVTGTVPDSAAGTQIVNTATVAAPADRTESDPSDNTASWTTDVPAFPDLATTATLTSADPLRYGETASWDVTVTNAGDGSASDSTVEITLPTALDPASVTLPAGCTLAGAVLTCDLGDLATGAAATISVQGTVAGVETACTSGDATLSAAASTTRRELVTDNNEASVSTPCVVPVDLGIEKSSNGTVTVGGTIVWTIRATNSAAVAAPATRVVDDSLPAGASWSCVVSDGSACSAASGTGAVDVTADVPAGGAVTVTARVVAASAGTVSNTASVTPCAACVDESTQDASATATVTVRAAAGGDGDLAGTGGTLPAGALLAGLGLLLAGAAGLVLGRRATR